GLTRGFTTSASGSDCLLGSESTHAAYQRFSKHAPARSRTWIYRLGGGRLVHWTTRARRHVPSGRLDQRLPACGLLAFDHLEVRSLAGELRQVLADQPVRDPFV